MKKKMKYEEGKSWGVKYFKGNFDRLVSVKKTFTDSIQLISLQSSFFNPNSGNFQFINPTRLFIVPRYNLGNEARIVVLANADLGRVNMRRRRRKSRQWRKEEMKRILRPDSGIYLSRRCNSHRKRLSVVLASSRVRETLPPELDSSSEPLKVFDGTTRLYISYTCPYAQRVWIARNYKGLQGKIELVPINLKNRPAWYQERVYAANKVPALEHNNRVIGESLDLIKYIDNNFEGPSLTPDGLEKQVFAEELLAYTNSFYKAVTSTFKGVDNDALDTTFNYIEQALSRFKEGSFFLGQFSLVDVAYAPFIERFQLISRDVMNVDITSGRPNLALWIQEMNKVEAYTQTRQDPKELVERYKNRVQART